MVLPASSGYWDSLGEGIDLNNDWRLRHPTEELAALVAANLIPKKSDCLDMHCGAGRDSIFLAQKGFRVTGIDPSKKALEMAGLRSADEKVKVLWLNRSAENTRLEDESFDFINDRSCFKHQLRSEREQYAREMIRLLRPGRLMLVRSCSLSENKTQRIVSQQNLAAYFPEHHFVHGPELRFTLHAPGGESEAVITLIRKK